MNWLRGDVKVQVATTVTVCSRLQKVAIFFSIKANLSNQILIYIYIYCFNKSFLPTRCNRVQGKINDNSND